MDSVPLDDEDDEVLSLRRHHGKVPPPVDPSSPVASVSRSGPLSMPIEQAANPTFEIVVGDPHKVGDLTSAHIVYSVRTKVIEFIQHFCYSRHLTFHNRLLPRPISSRNLQSPADIEISFGSTTL